MWLCAVGQYFAVFWKHCDHLICRELLARWLESCCHTPFKTTGHHIPKGGYFVSVCPHIIIFILCFSESLSRFATQRYRSTAGSLPPVSMSTKKCFNKIFRNFATVCPLCLESRCGPMMRWAALRGTVRHCLVWLVEHQLTAVQRRCVPCCATERTCGCQCDKGRYVAVVFIYTDVDQVVWEFSATGGT